jgi:hypothetical protein
MRKNISRGFCLRSFSTQSAQSRRSAGDQHSTEYAPVAVVAAAPSDSTSSTSPAFTASSSCFCGFRDQQIDGNEAAAVRNGRRINPILCGKNLQ